jgi:hypothetical protein
MTDKSNALHLGFDRKIGESTPRHYPVDHAVRHILALGSSGSGKTVFCKTIAEEMTRLGVPAICIDPQGDICSLAIFDDDPSGNNDAASAEEFSKNVEVVIFTPGSKRGIGLSADPFGNDPNQLDTHERVQAISNTSNMLTSLLGYSLDTDDGEGMTAVFDSLLTDLAQADNYPKNLKELTNHFVNLNERQLDRLTAFIEPAKLEAAIRKMRRLERGARKLIFHEGLPIQIDMLLGRGKYAPSDPNRTRLSVIYLNALHSTEDKEFFVAAIVEQLYSWMLKNPSQKPQALFYIDEVAPFLPPVRVPASKPGLQLLFKQARKYGVACLMATQNPGDVDYKSMAQFGTWALGRLSTRQDLSKIFPMIKSLAPDTADEILKEMPTLSAGQFIILAPDTFSAPVELQSRWLYTKHLTLEERSIEKICNERFREFFDHFATEASEKTQDKITPADSSETDSQNQPQPPKDPTTEPTPSPVATQSTSQPDPLPNESDAEPLTASSDEEPEQREDTCEEPPAEPEVDPALSGHATALGRKTSMTALEFSDRIGVTESQARRILNELVTKNLAVKYKDGRAHRFYSTRTGVRPDLGLSSKIQAITPRITEFQAEKLGREHQAEKKLGILGQDEKFVGAKLEYKLLLQLQFTEKVEKKFFKRLIGPKMEERKDSVYLHPRTMQIVTYSPNKAVRLLDKTGKVASQIADFDGTTTVEKIAPGLVSFDEDDWLKRIPDDQIKEEFKQLFNARPTSIKPILLPVWKLEMSVLSNAQTRIVTVDALSGKRMDW